MEMIFHQLISIRCLYRANLHLSIGPIPARHRIGERCRAKDRRAGSYSGFPMDGILSRSFRLAI